MRVRITAVVSVLVFTALAVTGAIIYTLESARLNNLVRANADQEIAEFNKLQSDGRDPATAEPFTSALDLLDVFLSRNVPGEDEILVGWIDGRARFVSGNHSDLASDPDFATSVNKLVATGDEGLLESSHGDVLVTVQPVRESTGRNAALVVVTFMDDARAELRNLLRTYTVVSLLSLGAITALGAWQSGRLLAPIRVVNDTARGISETDLSARLPVTGNDDLTALSVTINQMLERLEAAFAGQRQFLDDAGHELKTPLTILSGHLELLDDNDPVERAHTRALLIDEVDRMSRLVGDLILLAKSRRPDFVRVGPVDLADLTETLVAKAHGLGDRHWEVDGSAHAIVGLDEQRITQAMLQLADNAVKHTDPGAVIGIGTALEDDVVRLWVRDTGDGIPASEREAVLERFARSAVRPGDEGFGLGLSIVNAITQAHGGDIHIREAAPPPGAHVEIHLPAKGEHPWPRS